MSAQLTTFVDIMKALSVVGVNNRYYRLICCGVMQKVMT
jgi:hypothetical protein